jgi:hypothetical protein
VSGSLAGAATRLRELGAVAADVAARVPTVDPGPAVFGADAAGALGDLGRALHDQWADALRARSHEAAAVAAHLRVTADAVTASAQGYADADDHFPAGSA